MRRLLALDIDGTLLDPSDIVTPVVRAAIGAARAQGVAVALATGRRLRSTRRVVEELGIQLPLVLSNGALIWDSAAEAPLHEATFTAEAIATVLEASLAVGLAPILLQGPLHGEHLVVPAGEELEHYARAFGRGWRDVDSVPATALPETAEVLTIDIFGPERQLRALTDRLAARGLAIFHSGPLALETATPHWAANIHMPGVSKAAGVARLAADLGLTLADVVAVGDGENDLPLLEAAGIGVAMGNAAPDVRARADAVVRGHDADGVAEAIERFVLSPR
ncbi:MAG TPA: HAD family hydrolase [Thermomicrobiaceae bacterium]|nr:HAD family hydrolase [Thermomicrobiaceae bacterium]